MPYIRARHLESDSDLGLFQFEEALNSPRLYQTRSLQRTRKMNPAHLLVAKTCDQQRRPPRGSL